MFRLYDFECSECRVIREHVVEFAQAGEPPGALAIWCLVCAQETNHERRRVNRTAQYLADRPCSPMVAGGECDTTGYRRGPSIPEFTGEAADEFREFVGRTAYKDLKRERAARVRENKAKRKRAKAIRRGENIDVRHHPLPGDPKF